MVDDLPSAKIDRDRLGHLTSNHQADRLQLLDRYASCFSERAGFCNIVEHKIDVNSDFKPKKFKAYKILKVLKPEVDKQIDEMLIRRSDSPMASPMVCVIKRDKSVRIVVDYRYVNSFCTTDPFPIQNIDDVKLKVGRSNFITVADANSGYWQIPVRREYQWLTGFTTHRGAFESFRAPFGLKNSGSTFVRAVELILGPVKGFTDIVR